MILNNDSPAAAATSTAVIQIMINQVIPMALMLPVHWCRFFKIFFSIQFIHYNANHSHHRNIFVFIKRSIFIELNFFLFTKLY